MSWYWWLAVAVGLWILVAIAVSLLVGRFLGAADVRLTDLDAVEDAFDKWARSHPFIEDERQ